MSGISCWCISICQLIWKLTLLTCSILTVLLPVMSNLLRLTLELLLCEDLVIVLTLGIQAKEILKSQWLWCSDFCVVPQIVQVRCNDEPDCQQPSSNVQRR